MKKNTVIEIKDLKIDYRNLKHFSIQQLIKNPALKGGNVLHAIRGIDLEIEEGQVIGIIGANGAGKSTLLKAIAGIFQPDQGSIDTKGKRVSLMSLGVGFKWELTGRENIMIAGLLLRYPASYIKDKMQEIIDFSELGVAIDHPVRTYSSGMYSKLSFAITAILETDIMLVDELLSVGDEQFQKKSYDKITGLVQQENMTSVIVSHDMELIRKVCSRVIWMHKGVIVASGDPEDIVPMYIRWSRVMGAKPLKLSDDFSELTSKMALLPDIQTEETLYSKTPVFRGITVNEETGLLQNISSELKKNDPCCTAANWEPVFIKKGAIIKKKNISLDYHLFIYNESIPLEFIYIPLTSTEGNITSFSGEIITPEEPVCINDEDHYIRFLISSRDRAALPANSYLEDYIEISENDPADRTPDFLEEEIKNTCDTVKRLREEGDFVFILLTDSHMSVGGNWEDTVFSLQRLAQELSSEVIVHMGDLIDGQSPEVISLKQAKTMITEMKSTGLPVHLCPGNHDLDVLKPEYLIGRNETFHYEDFDSFHLRLIFLSGYYPAREDQYGYSDEELKFTEKLLKELPEDYGVLLFSHISPQRMKTKYGENIHNAGKLMQLLDAYGKQVRGVFYGHEHEDLITEGYKFPMIGQSCSKLEDCKREKPLHSGVFSRIPGEASQELFDVVIVKRDKKALELIRFGAGKDRTVSE